MAPRSRILAFGSAFALTVVGIACGLLVGGLTGQVLTIVLVSIGLGGAVLLVFLEVGLSEDRDRARDEQLERERGEEVVRSKQRLSHGRWPRRPS
jgi:uncharacterized membrane protein